MLENKFNLPKSFEEFYEPFLLPLVHKNLLIISDVHVPYFSYAGMDIMFDYCQDKNIDCVLLNGDFIDCHKLSKFVIDPRKKDFKEELIIANQVLDSIEMAFPKVKKYFKVGNHEERYEKYMMVKAPELLGIAEYRLENLLRLQARGIGYVTDKRIIYAGQLPIVHGHELNMKNTTVSPSRTLYLKAKRSAICSHLHVPSQHSGKRLDNHIISCWSTGHLGEEHPTYAPNNEWNLGFCTVLYDDKQYEVSNYKIINYKVYRT